MIRASGSPFRFASILAATVLFWAATGVCEPLQILVRPHLSKRIAASELSDPALSMRAPIELNLGSLSNRRFRIVTPQGRTLTARKLRPLGKKIQFATSGGKATAQSYSGDVRRAGVGNAGKFTLSIVRVAGRKEKVAATFVSPDSSQAIRSSPSGEQVMDSVVTTKLPDCGGEKRLDKLPPAAGDSELGGSSGGGAAPGASEDPIITIDIAVLLSPRMVTANGGLEDAIAVAVDAVDAANSAYTNSEVFQTLRIVYAGESVTDESNNFTQDLNRLITTNDSYFDDVPTLRTAYGADVVTLLAHPITRASCGIGSLMTSGWRSSAFAPYAYNVVDDLCAGSNYSLAHELGHNMGAAHNVEDHSGSQPAYSYSYGYRFTGTNTIDYRTVMAYASDGGNEIRVPYFSNPDVNYQGAATGTSNANNALTLNNTASIVAAFNPTPAQTPTPMPTATPYAGTPTPTPTPSPTATATATPLPAIYVKSLKIRWSGKICSIEGLLTKANGKPGKSLDVRLEKTDQTLVKSRTSNSKGGFSFKTTRNRRYVVKIDSRVSKSVRCR